MKMIRVKKPKMTMMKAMTTLCRDPLMWISIKSAKVASISHIVIYQLRLTYGSYHTKIVRAIVTPHIQPACYVVSCVLFSKLQDARWRVVQLSIVLFCAVIINLKLVIPVARSLYLYSWRFRNVLI